MDIPLIYPALFEDMRKPFRDGPNGGFEAYLMCSFQLGSKSGNPCYSIGLGY